MAVDTVYIGTKMPNGIILDLDRNEILNKEQGTIRTIKGTQKVRLKGTALPFGVAPSTMHIDGYVFTPVPKDFWDAWMAMHKDSSLLADGYIKPAASLDAGRKIAREHESERGQFPRLIEGDERTCAINVEAADEQKAKAPLAAA